MEPHRIRYDVFPIPSGLQISRFGRNVVVPGYFKMRSRFVDYPGLFVIHCHILAHEDRGMMTVVEVVPPNCLCASIALTALDVSVTGLMHFARRMEIGF